MDRLEEIRQRVETYEDFLKNPAYYKNSAPRTQLERYAYTDLAYLLSEVDRLQAALSESQRRERAAVEDLKDSIYNPYGCVYCKHQRIDRDTLYCDLDCDDENNMFEWRGPQDEKGATPNE